MDSYVLKEDSLGFLPVFSIKKLRIHAPIIEANGRLLPL